MAPPPKSPSVAMKPAVPKPPKEDGIGKQVSAWARSGIHGRELAAKIHQLQATKANPTPTGEQRKPGKPGKPDPTPPVTPKKPKKPKKDKC